MHSFRGRAIIAKLLVFACFAGLFFLISGKTDDFYLDQAAVDAGAQFLFRGWQHLLSCCGFDVANYARVLFLFQTAILFVFAGLMLLPRVPLPVAIGGEATLLLVWAIFRDFSSRSHAIEAWTVALVAMFVVAACNWRGRPRDYLTATAFGVALGYLPLMRQSAILQALPPCACLLGYGVVAAMVNSYLLRRKLPLQTREVASAESRTGPQNQDSSIRVFLRYATPAAVLLLFFFTTRLGVVGLESKIDTPPMRSHGVGYPLFASLGFANNVYNIAWDDDCNLSQGLLIEARPWYEDPYGQKKLTALWVSRVLQDPALLLRGLLAKSFYLLRYFSNTLSPMRTGMDGYPIKPSLGTLGLGIGAFVATAYCVRAFYRIRTDRMTLLAAGTTGVFMGAIMPLIGLVPFYLGSAIAAFGAVMFIIAPAVYFVAWEKPSAWEKPGAGELALHRNTLSYKLMGETILVALVVLMAFVLIRVVVNQNQARQLSGSDPMQRMRDLRQQYAYHFNRLSAGDQKSIIDRLLSSKHVDSVFRPSSSSESISQGIFRPVVAVFDAGARGGNSPAQPERPPIVFVIARLSENWKMRLPSRLQGPRNSLLFVKKNAAGAPPAHYYLEAPTNYVKIADANWDGRYRMFCLPAPADFLRDAKFIYAGAYNFKDGEHGPRGLVLDLISGNQLYPDRQSP